MTRTDIRLALPSKGRLQTSTLEFLAHCGFEVKANSARGYIGSIALLPNVTVLFQRPADIITSVRNGGVDLGITGMDVVADADAGDTVQVLHDALGFGRCKVVIAVPEALPVTTICWPAGRPSMTPLSQGFQPGILCNSSNTNIWASGIQLCRWIAARSLAMS